ncbi:hypothetical protein M0812_13740 [Anaeramoeba flamelloides]|uniref:Uncharacterized protein n=1 Tax=Anaeramoeba flamelloides TaxID=1746091 RepID=A0AAV7ZKY1_9EUKA|nr:hypothetical protein M0812_13740 [Anaeramoeba flamelloides]
MGNYSIKTSQIKVLTEEKFNRHLSRIKKKNKAICVLSENGTFVAFNFLFQNLLHITQTNIFDHSIIEFIPQVQPTTKKTSLSLLRDELDHLQNSKNGFQEFEFSFQARKEGHYIPTRTILSIFCVSKKIYFQLVSKPKPRKYANKRTREHIPNENFSNKKKILNNTYQLIGRSYTYTGVKNQQTYLKNTNKIRRIQTTLSPNYKPIIIHKNFTNIQRFRTPNLFCKNKQSLSSTKITLENNNNRNNNNNINRNHNTNVDTNNATTTTTTTTTTTNNNNNNIIHNINQQQNNELLNQNYFFNNKDFRHINDPQQLIDVQPQKNNFNSSNKRTSDYENNDRSTDNEHYKNKNVFKKKIENLKLTQQMKVLNKKSEAKINQIYSKIENIKNIIRNLEDHLIEYQVTNTMYDIQDLIKKTEKFYIFQLENLIKKK